MQVTISLPTNQLTDRPTHQPTNHTSKAMTNQAHFYALTQIYERQKGAQQNSEPNRSSLTSRSLKATRDYTKCTFLWSGKNPSSEKVKAAGINN